MMEEDDDGETETQTSDLAELTLPGCTELYQDPQHERNLAKSLYKLAQNRELCDVVLDVQGTLFYAHKCVLVSSCSYFEELFQTKKDKHTKIILPNHLKGDLFPDILQYIYIGQIKLKDRTVVKDILRVSSNLQLITLKQHCSTFFERDLSVENCFDTLWLADDHNLTRLSKAAFAFILANILKVIEQEEILKFSLHKLEVLLGNKSMPLTEEAKLHVMCRWIGGDMSSRKLVFDQLLGKILWDRVHLRVFYRVIQSEELLAHSELCLYFLFKHLNQRRRLITFYESLYQDLSKKFEEGKLNDQHIVVAPQEEVTDVQVHANQAENRTNSGFEQTESGSPKSLFEETQPRRKHSYELGKKNSKKAKGLAAKRNLNLKLKIPTLDPEYTCKPEFNTAEDGPTVTDSSSKATTSAPLEVTEATANQNRGQSPVTFLKLTRDKQVKKSRKAVPRRSKRKRVPAKKLLDSDIHLFEDLEEDLMMPGLDNTDSLDVDLQFSDVEDFSDEDQVLHSILNASFSKQDKTSKSKARQNHDEEKLEESPQGDELSPHRGNKRRGRRQLCQRFECDICGVCSYSADRLDQHKMQHVPEDVENMRFSCRACDWMGASNMEYKAHMHTTHYSAQPFRCITTDCTHRPSSLAFFMNHVLDHHDDRPFLCAVCNESFSKRTLLLAHIVTHSGSKPFSCPDCHRSFATKGTLEQHRVVHSDTRPFLCDLCGFSTKFHSHLQAHKRTHTGDVFKCQFESCTYSTPKRSQLACHMRSHMSIRQYTCQTCSRAFITRSHLTRHERLHKDQPQCRCSYCPYTTTRNDKLKEHTAKHHSEGSSRKRPYKARKPRDVKIPQEALPETDEGRSLQKQTTLQYHLTQAEYDRNEARSLLQDTIQDKDTSMEMVDTVFNDSNAQLCIPAVTGSNNAQLCIPAATGSSSHSTRGNNTMLPAASSFASSFATAFVPTSTVTSSGMSQQPSQMLLSKFVGSTLQIESSLLSSNNATIQPDSPVQIPLPLPVSLAEKSNIMPVTPTNSCQVMPIMTAYNLQAPLPKMQDLPLQIQALPPQYEAPPPQHQAPPLQHQAPPPQYKAPPPQHQTPPLQHQAPPLLPTSIADESNSQVLGTLCSVPNLTELFAFHDMDSPQIGVQLGAAGLQLLSSAVPVTSAETSLSSCSHTQGTRLPTRDVLLNSTMSNWQK